MRPVQGCVCVTSVRSRSGIKSRVGERRNSFSISHGGNIWTQHVKKPKHALIRDRSGYTGRQFRCRCCDLRGSIAIRASVWQHSAGSCRQRANTGQTFLAKSLYLSFSLNRSGAIAPRLSNNDPCTLNCGKLILAGQSTKPY